MIDNCKIINLEVDTLNNINGSLRGKFNSFES